MEFQKSGYLIGGKWAKNDTENGFGVKEAAKSRTKEAAKSVANELFDQWVWSNVYPMHLLTIIQKVEKLVKEFSILDRWPKKRRYAHFFEKESQFLQDIDKLFDIFCTDKHQRLCLERQYKLRMSDRDYEYYEDQKEDRKGRCVDEIIPLSSSNKKFIERASSASSDVFSTSEAKSIQLSLLSDTLIAVEEKTSSDPESIESSSSQFLPSAPSSSHSEQNRKSWPNFSKMCKRNQLSDRAGAALHAVFCKISDSSMKKTKA